MDGPIHKGIFPYVGLLPPAPNFPVMIYPAQVVWTLQDINCRIKSLKKLTKNISKYSYIHIQAFFL